MDYFTSRDKGLDDKCTKEESDNSLLYAQVCEKLHCARFSEVHNSCYLNKQGVIKSSETMPMINNGKLFRVTLVCLYNDAV